MLNMNRTIFTSISLAALVLSLLNFSPKVVAKADLVIEGNVLGYNLYTVKSTSNPGLMYPVLLKVTKVVQGAEKSQYVLILLESLEKDSAVEKFGLSKISTFRLKRQTFCDKKLGSLMYPGLVVDNGKVVETSQTFTLVPGVSKESLPMKKKVPCYFVTDEN